MTDRLNLGANVNWQSRSHTLDEYPADINPAAAAALTQRPYATLDLTGHYKIGKSTRISLDFETCSINATAPCRIFTFTARRVV